MHKFFVLTKVLLKNGIVFQIAGGRRRNLSLLIVAIALVPMMVSTTLLLMKTYDMLKVVNLEGVILAALLSTACLTMILFGILYVISIYYFSDDNVQLITMPLSPHLILASKFIIVTIYQYFLETVILLPGIIAFGIKTGSFVCWIYSAIIFLVLPVIPTVVCSVISILLMAFGKFFRNKDRVKFVAGFLAIAIAIGINVVIQTAGANTTFGDTLISKSALINRAAMLFPTNMIAVHSILNESNWAGLLFLILFLFISAAAGALFLLLGDRLYLSGVIGLSQSTVSGKHFSKNQFIKHSQKRPKMLALAIKDWRILYRTPVYFLNCVLSAIIFPLLMIVIFGTSINSLPRIQVNPLMISIGVIIVSFFCMMNMISPTAVSREGKNFFVSRYIPVPYRLQVLAKLIPGLALSFLSLIVTMLLTFFVIKIEWFALVVIFVLSLIALTAVNMLGLFVDIVFPKLDWDDETAAVKRNLNVAIELIILFVVLALPAFLVNLLKLGLYAGTAFLLLANMAILAASAVLLFTKGAVIYSGTPTTVSKGVKSHKDYRKMIFRVVSVVLVAALAVFMAQEFTSSPKIQVNATQVVISSGFMESSSFELSQIKSVYLKGSIPSTSNRVGFAFGNKLRGTFTVAGLGRGHVYTETGSGPFLYVLLKNNSFTIFNFSDRNETEKLYATLKKRVP